MTTGSRWDAAAGVLRTTLTGTVDAAAVAAWERGLLLAVGEIPPGATFKLLLDLRGFEAADLTAHRRMRDVVPRLLAAHGMRPAFLDLFDDAPEPAVTAERGVVCVAFANVHHDEGKMTRYEAEIGRADQRFFTSLAAAEAWLATPAPANG